MGEKATDKTLAFPCPLRVVRSWRVATSQSLTVLSLFSASEGFSIGGKGNGPDTVPVSLDGGKLLACRDIPELDRAVPTSASEGFSIGGKGNRQDTVPMSLDGGKLPACRYVPELDGAVPTSTSESCPIGGKGNGQDTVPRVLSRWQAPACRYVQSLTRRGSP